MNALDATWAAERQRPSDAIDSVLLIGQSNMCGRGIVGEVPEINPRGMMFMLRNGRWQPMSEPINPDRHVYAASPTQLRSGVSLAASFAEEYATHYQRRIGLIPCAEGGSALSEWQPGEILFDHAVSEAKFAQRTSNIVGILWHQGETDSQRAEDVARYRECFFTMLNAMKETLGLPDDIPVILGELSPLGQAHWPLWAQTNAVLHEIADSAPSFGIASVEDLTLSPDGMHFSAASYRVLGRRYFAAYRAVRERQG